MKTRFILVTSVLLSVSLRAADPAVDALVSKIEANPTGAPGVVAQIVAVNPARASDLFKAAYDATPERAMDILKTASAAVPVLAPTALEQALIKLTSGRNAAASAKIAASYTSGAIETILATNLSDDAKSKLTAALAATAARIVPGALNEIEEAAAQSAGSSGHHRRGHHHGRGFPHHRPPIIISPSR